MNVAFAADRWRVAQTGGNALNGVANVALGAGLAVELLEFLQRHGGQNGAVPRPKILCRDVGATDFSQIGIHVCGGHITRLAAVINILEQLLPGQVLAGADHLGDTPVANRELPDLAALALEVEAQGCAVDLDMPVLERGEAIALVAARVLVA